MSPKKHSISVSIPKELKLSAKEVASLKKAYKTHAVKVAKSRKGPDEIFQPDTNVITIGGGSKTRRKKPGKAASKKKR